MNQIEAPQQVFTYPLPDTKPETIVKAKKLIYECAGEMGFNANHTPFKIEKYRETETDTIKHRLEATFTA